LIAGRYFGSTKRFNKSLVSGQNQRKAGKREMAMRQTEIIDMAILDGSIIDILDTEEEQSWEFRTETRIKRSIPLYLRYQQSEPFWREEVISENISKNGILISTNTRIPVQTRLYIESANREFSALATVVHSTNWQAGLQILVSKGEWLGDSLSV
jgi:hypothetical protein